MDVGFLPVLHYFWNSPAMDILVRVFWQTRDHISFGNTPVVGPPGYMEVVGPSVILRFVNFLYPFKEPALGFIDIFLLFFLISILFISSLIFISADFRLCFSLSNSFRW